MSGEEAKLPSGYSVVLPRLLAGHAPILSKPALERLTARLLKASKGQRRLLLDNSPAGASLEAAARLLQISWAERRISPQLCREHAEAAVEIVKALPAAAGPAPLLEDLKAESWALLANALRLEERYADAGAAFRKATRSLKRGSRAPLLSARLASLEGSFRRAIRDLPTAIRLGAKAVHAYESAGFGGLAARERLKVAWAHSTAGQPALALDVLSGVQTSLQSDAEPDLSLHFANSVVGYLAELGHPTLAVKLLRRAAFLYPALGEELFLVRARWLVGRLLASLDALREAEKALDSVRKDFLARDLPYDAALCSLDLAQVLARQGKAWRVRYLAEGMYQTFVAQAIPREATAALLLFYDAAIKEEATTAFVSDVVARLAEVRRHVG